LYNTSEAAWNKLSSFLIISIQNTQILQLFIMNFRTEKIINIIKNAKLWGLGLRDQEVQLKEGRSTSNFSGVGKSRECFSTADIHGIATRQDL